MLRSKCGEEQVMRSARNSIEADVTRLIAWAHAAYSGSMPDAVKRRAAQILGDDLGAMIAARNEPEVIAFHAKVRERKQYPEATIFCGGQVRVDRFAAATANAVAACWLELDEGYRKVPCHAGLYILPALMAEAEASDASVDEVLRAIVIAYELVTRVARGWKVRELNMHSHARYGAIGAAAAIGLIRRIDEAQLLAAVSAAATFAMAGPREHAVHGALVRNTWAATGAWSGMMSVDWAACGIGGIPGGFYDVFSTVLGGDVQSGALVDGLGESWAVLDGYTKTHACCQHLHSTVEAVLELRTKLSVSDWNQAVERIEVEAHPYAQPLNNSNPPTTLAAKFSLPHVVATTLVHGDAGVASFSVGTLRDPDITALRSKVRLLAYEPQPAPPNDRPSRVTLHMKDGSHASAVCLSAPGGPDQPLDTAEVLRKLDRLAGDVYPQLRAWIEQLMRLEPAQLNFAWRNAVAEFCA